MDNLVAPPAYRESHGARIICADSLTYLRTLADNSIDSIVTDPPYEIGFMGKGWDSTGIAYNVDLWKECLRVLKPGGHALVFGATRTYHRVACAIEDAGFEIRDSINWMYGAGFPKSLDVSKAIDKAAGAERKVVGINENVVRASKVAGGSDYGGFTSASAEITGPATDAAKQWAGWGTALKPAHEPIVVARKPLDGTVATNVLAWGTGAINIDASRVGRADGDASRGVFGNGKIGIGVTGQDDDGGRNVEWVESTAGRFPANVILTHGVGCKQIGQRSETVAQNVSFSTDKQADGWGVGKPTTEMQTQATPVYRCAPGCPAATLDQQTGEKPTGGAVRGQSRTSNFGGGLHRPETSYGDTGGASRFFTNTEADPFFYSGKAAKKERPTHPETGQGHATVKPLSVMRWLINLATQPGGVVLDPFAGSGSTAEAALLDGFQVIAIDIDPAHMPLIDVRIDRFAAGQSPVRKAK